MSMLIFHTACGPRQFVRAAPSRPQGDDIGIVVDGKIVALRPAGVESMDCATREYGATITELEQFEKRTHGQIVKARKEGKLRDFTGDIEALLEGKGH